MNNNDQNQFETDLSSSKKAFYILSFIAIIIFLSIAFLIPIPNDKNINNKNSNLELINSLKYFKDEKTNLCFAIFNNNQFSYVPCSKKVDNYIFLRKPL